MGKYTYTNKNGYKQHYNPKSPDARKSGFSPVHRDVARYKYNRNIKPWEVVHHKDGNKSNNSRDNLIIMSRSKHSKMHAKQRNKGDNIVCLIIGVIIAVLILILFM